MIQPVVIPVWQPVVSCIQTFNRLSNGFDNRLNEQWLFVQHDCQTGLYNRFDKHSLTTVCTARYNNLLNEQLFVQHGCQTSLTTGLTTGWMLVYTILPVVKPVWQPVVSCKWGYKVQKFSSGTGSPGWSQKKVRKMVVGVHRIRINPKESIGSTRTEIRTGREHPATLKTAQNIAAKETWTRIERRWMTSKNFLVVVTMRPRPVAPTNRSEALCRSLFFSASFLSVFSVLPQQWRAQLQGLLLIVYQDWVVRLWKKIIYNLNIRNNSTVFNLVWFWGWPLVWR